jgi:hypothetical protein
MIKTHPTAIEVYVQKSRPLRATPLMIEVRESSNGRVVFGFASHWMRIQ